MTNGGGVILGLWFFLHQINPNLTVKFACGRERRGREKEGGREGGERRGREKEGGREGEGEKGGEKGKGRRGRVEEGEMRAGGGGIEYSYKCKTVDLLRDSVLAMTILLSLRPTMFTTATEKV